MFDIEVMSDDWGDASVGDIQQVLASTAAALTAHIPRRTFPVIQVTRTTADPITLYELAPSGAIQVRLNVQDCYWAQFAFQFGHELCHILCGHSAPRDPNAWFEETICEVASLFVLGQMAEAWRTNPPYPNWASYSSSLRQYRDDRMREACLPAHKSLPEFLQENEASLRHDPHQRQLNLAMATCVIGLFEAGPKHWEAIDGLNRTRGGVSRSFAKYLNDWYSAAHENHRGFIRSIAGLFGERGEDR
jgi:hypothetical protein